MRFKNLERYRKGGTLNKMVLEVPLPRTPDGRVYRYSPNEAAQPRHFVLGDFDRTFQVADVARLRMKIEPRSNQTVCPYSGTVAEDDAFTHPDDIKAAQKIVEHAAMADAHAMVDDVFGKLSRSFANNKFVRMTYRPSAFSKPKPRFYRKDLLRELACDHCGRDYGVFAIALFCPDCGAPNLRLHFAREVHLVGAQVDLAEAQANEELAYRLLGNAHEDVLSAFEATLKVAYLYGVTRRGADREPPKPVRNDFQNAEIARRRFAEFALDPFSVLNEDDLATLQLNIQKRHIIGHNLGVMDARFAEHWDDARIGETVHLVGEDVRHFAALCQRVINCLDDWLCAAPSAEANGVAAHEAQVAMKDTCNEPG